MFEFATFVQPGCGRARALRIALLLGSCTFLWSPRPALAHPLHTSLAELSYDSRSGLLAVSLRVFVDDFSKASSQRRQQLVSRGGSSNQSPLVDYALASFEITDASGRRVVLQSCGSRRVDDLMWLCFKGSVPRGTQKLSVASSILFDMYRDQINIVKATVDKRTSSLLFTPGDGAKLLAR